MHRLRVRRVEDQFRLKGQKVELHGNLCRWHSAVSASLGSERAYGPGFVSDAARRRNRVLWKDSHRPWLETGSVAFVSQAKAPMSYKKGKKCGRRKNPLITF